MTTPERTNDSGLSLLGLALALARYKKLLFRLPLLGTGVVLLLSLLIPNTYVGVSKILPPQSQSLSAQLMGQLGAASTLAGGLLAAPPGLLFVGMLQGDSIADKVIDRFNLFEKYPKWHGGKRTRIEMRDKLSSLTTISLSPEGLIVVKVQDSDPAQAAQMANAYVEEFRNLRRNLEILKAADRVNFFNKQIAQARSSLADAETQFKQTQERTGLVVLEGQGIATIEASAQLRAQVSAKEAQLEAMRLSSTASNPDYRRTLEELNALRRELGRADGSSGRQKGDLLLSTSKLPEHALEYARKFRDVKYNEILVELLFKQYELARIEQSQDFSAVDVVDIATPPDTKDKPNRVLIGIASYIVLLLFSMLGVVALDSQSRLERDPHYGEQARELGELLRPKGVIAKFLEKPTRFARRWLL